MRAALLLAVLLPLPAQAHVGAMDVGDFWLGFLHPLVTLQSALALLALGLLAGQSTERTGLRLCQCFALLLALGACAAVYGVQGAWTGWINLASLLVLGGLVALAWSPPAAVLTGLSGLFALGHGLSNGAEILAPVVAWKFIPGLAIAGFILPFYLMLAVRSLKPWWTRIAVRVTGSWIAAVGLLVIALESLRPAAG